MKRISIVLGATAFALVLAGVSVDAQIRDQEKNGRDQTGNMGGTGQTQIIREVRHELVMLPYYGVFDNLTYRVAGGTVTLFGQVTRPTLKRDAERAVKG